MTISDGSIFLVIPWSPNLPGGVSVVVRQLKREMAAKGYRPIIVVNNWDASTAIVDSEGSINFRFAIIGKITLTGLVKSFINLPARVSKTLRLLRQFNVKAVNFHYPSTEAIVIALLKRLGLYQGSLVFSFHGSDVQPTSGIIEKLFRNFILRSAQGITACSAGLAKKIAEVFLIDPRKVAVIFNGVDTNLFAPNGSSRHDGVPSAPSRYIVSVGSYLPIKGHSVLLDAFKILSSEFPDLHLVIAGMDGPEREVLQTHARKLKIGNRLTCLVSLPPENVARVIASATICVQPSLSEAFGMAIIEAGSCGVPVVASAVGGHLELIDDKQTGFLFASMDHVQCATILRELLNHPEMGIKAADSFRRKILARYTWGSCAQGYIKQMALDIPSNTS